MLGTAVKVLLSRMALGSGHKSDGTGISVTWVT